AMEALSRDQRAEEERVVPADRAAVPAQALLRKAQRVRGRRIRRGCERRGERERGEQSEPDRGEPPRHRLRRVRSARWNTSWRTAPRDQTTEAVEQRGSARE